MKKWFEHLDIIELQWLRELISLYHSHGPLNTEGIDARKYRYWCKHIYVWAIIYHSPGPLNTEGIALDPFYGTLSPRYGSSVSSKCPSGTWWSNCRPVCSGPLIPRQSTAGASLAEPWGNRCQRNDLELQGCLARRMERWLMYWW